MHGSHPPPANPRAGRRGDVIDVGLLLLPVVLAIIAFVVANLL
jgi:hypothetical protein